MRWTKQRWWLIVVILAIALVIIGREEERCQTQVEKCRASYAAQALSEKLPINISVNQKASEQEAIAAACEPNGYFCRLFGPANLPTVLLVLIGIGATWAALRTLWAIERQAALMEAQFDQWVVLTNWRTWKKLRNGVLRVTVDLVNPTNFPITLSDGYLQLGKVLYHMPSCPLEKKLFSPQISPRL